MYQSMLANATLAAWFIFNVKNVDGWHREIVEKGLHTPYPQDQKFGLRGFRIHDLDGNQLNIATRL